MTATAGVTLKRLLQLEVQHNPFHREGEGNESQRYVHCDDKWDEAERKINFPCVRSVLGSEY